jgi:hypothetical protein
MIKDNMKGEDGFPVRSPVAMAHKPLLPSSRKNTGPPKARRTLHPVASYRPILYIHTGGWQDVPYADFGVAANTSSGRSFLGTHVSSNVNILGPSPFLYSL